MRPLIAACWAAAMALALHEGARIFLRWRDRRRLRSWMRGDRDRIRMKKALPPSALRELPDFFDLLSLALAAGLDLEQAFSAALPHLSNGDLKKAVEPLVDELRLGLPRDAVFVRLQNRLGAASSSAMLLLNQALHHGFPMETSLRNQADALRRQRQGELEKSAQTVGLRLLIPIGTLIFPAMLLLLFGGLGLMMKQDGGWLHW